jgi:hypothetical protein
MANPSLHCTIPVGSNPPIVQIRAKQYNQDFATHQNVPVALNHTGVIIDVAKPGQPQDLRIACALLRADGHLCGSVLKNQDHNVRSHKSDLHKPGSEYEENSGPQQGLRLWRLRTRQRRIQHTPSTLPLRSRLPRFLECSEGGSSHLGKHVQGGWGFRTTISDMF